MLTPSGGGGSGGVAEGGKATGKSAGAGILQGLMDWISANGPTLMQTVTTLFLKLVPLVATVALKIGFIILYNIGQGLLGLGSSLLGWILQPFIDLGNSIISTWNWVKSIISAGISTVISVGTGAISLAQNLWNSLKSTVGGGISTAIDVATGAINWAKQKWTDLVNWITGHPAKGTVSSSGPRGFAGPKIGLGIARGPGLGLHYENYTGHQKNAWNAAGTCLTGNCVDMTLGLMSRYGGGMVAGTWNGGPHVWWQAPSGQQLDPARKALDGTWTPPARGPNDPSFGTTIVIQGDIYGFEDFKKKVEEANTEITFDAARF
jgi:hypothetical protein